MEPVKKKKWPWIVGGLFLVGLVGSIIDPVEKQSNTPETSVTTTTESKIEQPYKERTRASMTASEKGTEETFNAGAQFEKWYLGQYDEHSWDYVCGKYGGWECNVLDVDSPAGLDGTIVIVTTLSKDNPEGKQRAEGAVKSIQNLADLEPEMKDAIGGKADYVQVWDAQGNVLASGNINYGA
ncbi:hypothetical protein [uncultured Corynebacterium sp.]|uniref:hypothetical protein n=1 Tax=uncultured Corynebacterium sp. TaxID=159447 RepID=UPI002638F000|nr:hypothetical protein [uncultured Corynebacterium sp.]